MNRLEPTKEYLNNGLSDLAYLSLFLLAIVTFFISWMVAIPLMIAIFIHRLVKKKRGVINE